MAQNVFNAESTYKCRLYPLKLEGRPRVTGTLAADTVEINDPVFGKEEYAVFTVSEPENSEFPPAWVGTYRLPMSAKNLWYGGEVE